MKTCLRDKEVKLCYVIVILSDQATNFSLIFRIGRGYPDLGVSTWRGEGPLLEVCFYILPSSVSHDISYPLLFIYLMTLQIRFYFSSLVPKLPIRSFPMCTPPILRLQPFSVYDNVRLGNDALELRTDSDSMPSCVCLHLGLQQELGRVGKWTVKKEKSSNYCPLFFF